MASLADWASRDVLDLGCGTGFHLPRLAATAAHVFGVEPHPALLRLAARRTHSLGNVTLLAGTAQAVPLPDKSVDVAHARWAYFFGPGCEPGLRELGRVVRRGGTAFVIDNDPTRSTFGRWFRRGYPDIDPAAVERFWSAQGWTRVPLEIDWRFEDRADLEAVVRIEFAPEVAAADPRRAHRRHASTTPSTCSGSGSEPLLDGPEPRLVAVPEAYKRGFPRSGGGNRKTYPELRRTARVGVSRTPGPATGGVGQETLERLHQLHGDLLQRLAHRGEAAGHHLRDLRVVEADHRDVASPVDAAVAQGVEHTHRQGVGGADERRRAAPRRAAPWRPRDRRPRCPRRGTRARSWAGRARASRGSSPSGGPRR